MTTATEGTNQNELRLSLEAATLQEVRSKAQKIFGLKVTREHDKDTIIHMIMGEAARFDFAQESAGDLKPGWSRIRVHPVPGKPMSDFYFCLNGYNGCIPINVDVDVPNKVVGLLRDAQENQPMLNNKGEVEGFALHQSYPFTLIEQRPGPDPRPGFEVQREAKLRPKYEFQEKNGYWPSDAEMRQQRQMNILKGI